MPRVDIRRAQRISVHEIGDAPVKVGRLTDNDLVLRNIHVSRHHCVFEKVDGRLRVRDLDTTSGTWVNGDRVSEAILYAGDRVSVGPFDLVMRAAPDDTEFVSRSIAMNAALQHVAIDDDTGLPVEGPAALVDDLNRQLEAERKQHRKTAAQVAGLLQQVDDLQAQMAATERSGLLLDEQAVSGRVTELEQALAEANERARNAERREIERIASLQAEIDRLSPRLAEAETRANELTRDLDALRRESIPPSAAEQIAEIEGRLDIERSRAHAAERQATELQGRLDSLLRDRDELARSAERAAELEARLQQERDRAEAAAARLGHIETTLQAQAEQSLVEASDERGRQLEGLQELLREARATAEAAAAEHHATLQRLEQTQSELDQWRSRVEESERSLETERAHATDLNRALEEAWHRIDEAEQSANLLHGRVEELETSRQQQAERAAEALAAHVAEIERLTSSEAILNRELETAQSQSRAVESSMSELRERLETAEASLHHGLARASELEQTSALLQDRLAAAEREARQRAEQAAAELAAREQRLAELQASEESLRQRLNNLEATKFAASQKAERALGTLNLLQGQIRSLDDAAAKVTDLQSRLARIEEAWVAADESLESVDDNDESQVAAAVEQRQRIVAELDALNKARDAAVASLRESALRLRSISDRQAPSLITIPPPQPSKTVAAAAVAAGNNGGKKWWNLKK